MNYFLNSYFAYTQLILTDIYPIQYGEQQCESCHFFGPCIRSNYLIHYVYDGKGIFKVGNKEYPVTKGQMFLICPNQLAYYEADKDNPWLYCWIEFNGSMAAKIINSLSEQPIILDNADLSVGKTLLDIVKNGDMKFELLMQKFWSFILALNEKTTAENQNNIDEYIKKAEYFIKINLHKKITVTDVSDYIGINRSYLSRLFSDKKGVSPQDYILTLKMNTATQYLKNPNITVSEVAQSVGYSDTHTFNKAFKSRYGVSPSAWRQKIEWAQFIIS